MLLDPPPGRLDLPLPVELCVVEHEHSLGVERRLVRRAYDDGTVQAALELHDLVAMWVIPERPRVRQTKAIDERLARRDRVLDHVSTIHCRRDLQPMPVDRGGLGKSVREADLQHITHTSLDRGPGDLTVESPSLRQAAWGEFPVDLPGVELYLDHGAISGRNSGLVCVSVRGTRVIGHTVDHRPMAVPVTTMAVVVMRVRGVAVVTVMVMRFSRHGLLPSIVPDLGTLTH